MSDPQLPEVTYESRLQALEARISQLEKFGTSGLSSSEGTFTSIDASGNRRVQVGKIGTHYGMQVLIPGSTAPMFYVDENGMDTPQFPLPQNFTPLGANPYVQINAGAGFQIISRTILPVVIAHKAVRVVAGYAFTAGSTGRIRVVAGAHNTTSPVVSGAGGTTEVVDWLHQLSVGVPIAPGFLYYIDIQGIVDTGGGVLQAYEPSVTLMNDSHGATTAGFWTSI
jgi:hypothetical protein